MRSSFRKQRSARLIAAGCLAMTSTFASGQFQAHAGPAERVFNAEAYIDYQFGIPASGRTVGSLFSAVNGAPEHPAALLPSHEKGVRVAINPDAIAAIELVADARLTMPCFDGQTFELAFVLEEKMGRDTSIWYGQIAGVPRSDVILVHHQGYVGAEIRDYASKRHYQIRPTPDGGQALYEVKQAGNAGAWCGGHGAGGAAPYDPQVAPQGRRNLRGSVSDPINQVDIMTIVTVEARVFYGFEQNFVIESALAVSDFNLRADNSSSDVNLRLVAADWDLAGSYNEASTLGGDLNAMGTGGSLHSALQSARELYRPDVIAMIRQFPVSTPDGTALGLAFRPESLPISTSTCISTNVRGGSLSFVGYIFAHEVGHNFGGAHDLDTVIADGGLPFPGQFPAVTGSPMGRVVTCENGCIGGDEYWHTTMAYGPNSLCGGSVLLPYFSRPNLNFNAPFPCGTYPLGTDPSLFIGANVGDLLFLTRSSVSDNLLHATLAWTEPALSGFQSEAGTHLFPYSRITDAVNTVQGGADHAVVRAKAGTYEETQAAGGPVVFSNGTQINAIGGVVVIR